VIWLLGCLATDTQMCAVSGMKAILTAMHLSLGCYSEREREVLCPAPSSQHGDCDLKTGIDDDLFLCARWQCHKCQTLSNRWNAKMQEFGHQSGCFVWSVH